MRIVTVHERILPATVAQVGALLDGLAGPDDRLWPVDRGPGQALRCDRPLGAGAAGGHGPIRYRVEEYVPGRRVVFRFAGKQGLDGTHRFEVDDSQGVTELRHVLEGWLVNAAAVRNWRLVILPLHDALLEDLLDRAELAVTGQVLRPAQWSRRVRLLRRLFAKNLLEPRPGRRAPAAQRPTTPG